MTLITIMMTVKVEMVLAIVLENSSSETTMSSGNLVMAH